MEQHLKLETDVAVMKNDIEYIKKSIDDIKTSLGTGMSTINCSIQHIDSTKADKNELEKLQLTVQKYTLAVGSFLIIGLISITFWLIRTYVLKNIG